MLSRLSLFALFAVLLAGGSLAGGSLGGPDAISPQPAEATTTTIRWGPYTAPAFNKFECIPLPQTGSNPCWHPAKPCSDCYITSIVPSLVYWDGNPANPSTVANYSNGPMLHHFVIWNEAKVDATCWNNIVGAFGDRFFASGNERTVMSLPSPYGYYAAASPGGWNLAVHVHNPAPDPKTVYVEVQFTWQPASDNLKDVRPVWLDEVNCGNSQYPICASGPYPCYDDRHWDWTSEASGSGSVEGRIITIGGHVHDWGVSVAVEKRVAGLPTAQTGEWLCASSGGYAAGSAFDPDPITSPQWPNNTGHPQDAIALSPGDSMYAGHIEEMTSCTPNAKVAPGDTLRLHSQYNADGSIPDVMGIMTAFVYDNCSGLSNPDQHDTDADLLGDPCDPDIDGDSILNASDSEADGDGLSNTLETNCGSNPMHGLSKPERVDGAFAGADEDMDGANDEALPGSASGSDCDGDGYKGSAENHVTAYLGQTNGDQKRCQEYDSAFPNPAAHVRPSKRWPSDIASTSFSFNKVNIQDLSSFTNPIRYLNKDVGTNPMDQRFDLVPGSTVGADINVADMAALTTGVSGFPPMLGGSRAFNGPVCPTPP
jgi:hypothetical protein